MTSTRTAPRAIALAVLLAIFAFALAPTKALADTGTCVVGDATYTSLADAVAAAPEGTATTIVLTSDQALDATVVIPAGKDITITNDAGRRYVKLSDTASGVLFDVQGKLTLNANNFDSLHLVGSDASAGASVALVNGNGHLILGSATVEGGNLNKEGAGAIKVTDSATFDLKSGRITNTYGNLNSYPDSSCYTAPVVVTDSATMNMTGGDICNNTAKADFASSGVIVVGVNGSTPVLNMSGGSILGNTAKDCSAVYVISGGEFNLSGGKIQYNTATSPVDGSAVIVENGGASMNMTGGLIEGNTSEVSTVLVYVNASGTFSGGTIRYNTAKTAGGAIFAYYRDTTLTVNNAVVYGNSASVMGGGLWYCPTGAGEVNANSGMAIFSNAANGAGDDFVSLFTVGKQADVYLSNRVLGGGTVAYHEDGAVMPGDPRQTLGEVDATVPRFDAGNPGDPVVVEGTETESLALKAVISNEAIANAKNCADFLVYGNEAPYGGGIACNGVLTSGIHEVRHDVTVSKQDGAQASVSGAKLQVTSDSGLVFDEWVTEDGVDRVLQLPEGTYTLTEVETPEGYQTADPITFTVDADGNVTVAGETVDMVVMVDEQIEDEVPSDGDGGDEADGEDDGDGDGDGAEEQSNDGGDEGDSGEKVEKTVTNETVTKTVTTVTATPNTGDPASALPAALGIAGAALLGIRTVARCADCE